jgi:hypothetical protein
MEKTLSHMVPYQRLLIGPSEWRIGIMLMEEQLTPKMVALITHPRYKKLHLKYWK